MQTTQRRTIIGRLIAIIISIAALVWIALSFDLENLWEALREANYWLLIPVSLLILISFVSRATRWSKLFEASSEPRWQSLFRSLMVGYLANNVLPARTGDLVRAYALRRDAGIAGSTAFATVVVERVVDLVVTLILLGGAMLFFPLPGWSGGVGLILGLISLCAVGFLIVLNIKGVNLIQRITGCLRFLPPNLVRRANTIGEGFVKGVESLQEYRRVVEFLIMTGFIWLIEIGITFIMARAFNLPLGFGEALFVILIIAIGIVVPAAPGAIGTYEFFGVTALDLLGVSSGGALGFLLALHAVTFVGSSLIGAICLSLQPSLRASMTGSIDVD
jgi:hypothetical protein